MYQHIMYLKTLERQYQAAAHFYRFDVQYQDKWLERVYQTHEKILNSRLIWITNAFYKSQQKNS